MTGIALSRRDALVGGLALGVAAASVVVRPQRLFQPLSRAAIEAAIPQAFGDWRVAATSGLILPPPDEISRKIYDQILTRVYAAPDRLPVMALFAYGSIQNLTFELHRPEQCYPEQGFTLSPPVHLPVTLGTRKIMATALSAQRENYSEQLLYWTRIGNDFPESNIQEKLVVAKDNLTRQIPDGMLVRISVSTSDRAGALALIQDFVQSMNANLPPLGRQLVQGQATAALVK